MQILNVREEGVNGSDTFVDFFVPISQIDRETVRKFNRLYEPLTQFEGGQRVWSVPHGFV